MWSCVWGVLKARAMHSFQALFEFFLLVIIASNTLIWSNSIKYQMKIVFQVKFATNLVTSEVKSFKETFTQQIEAVYFLPRIFFLRNFAKTPDFLNNIPYFNKEHKPEFQALIQQDFFFKCAPCLPSSHTWMWSSSASPYSESPILFWIWWCTKP